MVDEAWRLAESLRDPRLNAHIRHAQAALAAAARDYAHALALDRESLVLYREIGDVWMAVIVQWAVGISATVLGHFDEARAHFASCIQTGLDLGNRWGAPYAIEAFGVLAVAEHQYERGAQLLGAAEAMRAGFGLSPEPTDHPALRAILASATDALASESAKAARLIGRKMSADEAKALALETPQ